MISYVADFETTTDPADCRVWAWAVARVDDPGTTWTGTDICSFLDWCSVKAPAKVYFHNLGFDGSFVLSTILMEGYEWTPERTEVTGTFTTLLGDNNELYEIRVNLAGGQVVFWDSLKVIPLKVADIPKAFGLPDAKLTIDYDEYRAPGHELTEDEKAYVLEDVVIVAKALAVMFGRDLRRMTAASNALEGFKETYGGRAAFLRDFPVLDDDEDAFVRLAYRGGFTYASPTWAGQVVGCGQVFDVNSLYPSVMHDRPLPFGKGEWFDGEPKADRRKPLWVACVRATFHVKPGHIPCLQLKKCPRYGNTEYITVSKGVETLFLSSVDWELFTRQYDYSVVEWVGGFKYRSSEWMFRRYVDYWTKEKIEAGKEGNAGRRTIAKLMLNSLYGKFGTRRDCEKRKPVVDRDGSVGYVKHSDETRDPVYIPVAVFVTSWARYVTVTAAQSCGDRFAYADTDSIHVLGMEPVEGLRVDPYELGAWKLESTFTRAKYLHAKCYIEQEGEDEGDGGIMVKVAGMPSYCHSQVTFENFKVGAVYHGKLYRKRVPGGTVLVPGDMVLRG